MKNLFLLLLLLYTYPLSSQTKANINASKVISSYFDAIGGESRWANLKSRISREKYLVYSSGMIESVSQAIPFVEYYRFPNNYLTYHTKGLHMNLVVTSSTCAWIYFGKDESIFFRSKENIRDRKEYPRIEVLEFLNAPVKGKVTIEGENYKINFMDNYGGRLVSIFFNKETFLIEKYTFYTQHSFHENIYGDYRTKDGFTEPYKLDNYVDGNIFKTIIKEDITYNSKLESSFFNPPVPCSGFNNLEKLKNPLPNIYAD